MGTLHITPSDSAGGSLLQAIRGAGRDDPVLPFRDDLSCGPIDPGDPAVRAAWWSDHYDGYEIEEALRSFWNRVADFDGRLVVWFARRSARELAFFLAWSEQLAERSYDIVDVTGRRLPFRRLDGSVILSKPIQAVSIVQSGALQSL